MAVSFRPGAVFNPRPLGEITLDLPLLINEEFKESHLIPLVTNERRVTVVFSLSLLSLLASYTLL